MNEAMYLQPQTQAYIKGLKTLGVEFVEPDQGYLACGDEGWGRLAEPEKVVREGLALIAGTESLKGKTILVTAGPTREFMDPVRFLSNPSSGKMGYELAKEALRRGAEVTLVTGPTTLLPPAGAKIEKVTTAAEMKDAVLRAFPRADAVVMAAAVSDFRFKDVLPEKGKKRDLAGAVEIEQTEDILALLGKKKKNQVLVGFAAETGDMIGNARKKMAGKRADLMVANPVGVGRGFETDDNEVHILHPSGQVRSTPRLSKREISRAIFDEIERVLEKKRR
jgi:phosphopantothenoylcysteine decarboxylase/phosphopantothenate--cysteine ligase